MIGLIRRAEIVGKVNLLRPASFRVILVCREHKQRNLEKILGD